MQTNLEHTLQFLIKEMSITLSSGETLDLTSLFGEINLYENMFTPCRSGNVLIHDAVGLYNKLNISGNEIIRFKIQKSKDDVNLFLYYKEFRVYKITNRSNDMSTVQSYVLHFVNEDFVFSSQKKLSSSYTGLYSDIVRKILVNDLKVKDTKPTKGKSGIGQIYSTDSFREFIVPNLTPFETIDWMTKRSVSTKYKTSDYLFYENEYGYNFTPISSLWEQKTNWNINVKPKNTTGDLKDELFGARNVRVLSQFNMLNNIRDGVYAGKFLGFDTLTKTLTITEVKNSFDTTSKHGNKNSNLTNTKTKDNKNFSEMYDSRIVSYPFSVPRITETYIKENSPKTCSVIDNTHEYIFQRAASFSNFLQKRIELTMPGNFSYSCGSVINLDMPKFSMKEDEKNTDDTLSGRYIITGLRHIIRFNMHETIIEIATDSTKR
jgi:hypothetical protein